ncbi:uncharacterized protein GJ701_000840 [Geothlypis trichas]
MAGSLAALEPSAAPLPPQGPGREESPGGWSCAGSSPRRAAGGPRSALRDGPVTRAGTPPPPPPPAPLPRPPSPPPARPPGRGQGHALGAAGKWRRPSSSSGLAGPLPRHVTARRPAHVTRTAPLSAAGGAAAGTPWVGSASPGIPESGASSPGGPSRWGSSCSSGQAALGRFESEAAIFSELIISRRRMIWEKFLTLFLLSREFYSSFSKINIWHGILNRYGFLQDMCQVGAFKDLIVEPRAK